MRTCLLATQLPMFGPAIKRVLERLDFKVIVAADGRDALAEYNQQIPDVVLITDGLPPFGAEQTVRAMRDVEGGNATKIIVVVRLDELGRIPAVRAAGADDCGAAPVPGSVEQLLRRNGLLKS